MSTILVISDLQAPFMHKDAVPFLKELKQKYKPDKIVCIGDEIDFHSLSDYDPDPDGYSPGHELERAIESLQPIYKLFPKTLVCESNHTSRPFRKAYKHGIPRALMRNYNEFLRAPKGWQWAMNYKIEGIQYQHGHGFSGRNGAANAAIANMRPTVIGHIHSHAGVNWVANAEHLIYGFNVGCLMDTSSYAAAYGATYPHKPIISAGIVKDRLPILEPMNLDRRNRWRGDL